MMPPVTATHWKVCSGYHRHDVQFLYATEIIWREKRRLISTNTSNRLKKIMATLAFSYKITAKIKLNSMIPSKSLCALITKVDNNYKNKSRRQCKFNTLPCRVPGGGYLRILDIHDYQMSCKYRRVTGQLFQEKCSFVYMGNRK